MNDKRGRHEAPNAEALSQFSVVATRAILRTGIAGLADVKCECELFGCCWSCAELARLRTRLHQLRDEVGA